MSGRAAWGHLARLLATGQQTPARRGGPSWRAKVRGAGRATVDGLSPVLVLRRVDLPAPSPLHTAMRGELVHLPPTVAGDLVQSGAAMFVSGEEA